MNMSQIIPLTVGIAAGYLVKSGIDNLANKPPVELKSWVHERQINPRKIGDTSWNEQDFIKQPAHWEFPKYLKVSDYAWLLFFEDIPRDLGRVGAHDYTTPIILIEDGAMSWNKDRSADWMVSIMVMDGGTVADIYYKNGTENFIPLFTDVHSPTEAYQDKNGVWTKRTETINGVEYVRASTLYPQGKLINKKTFEIDSW